MQHNSDVQSLIDGEIVDMRIETLLAYIHAGMWGKKDLDVLFNEVLQEFVHPAAPMLYLGQLEPNNCSMVAYLQILSIDFSIVFEGSPAWPGAYPYLPDAKCAVTLCYTTERGKKTLAAPGRGVNHAILAALAQYAREVSTAEANQGALPLSLN